MHSRRTKALTLIAGLAAIAVLTGNAARGSEDAAPTVLEPAVTVTPYAAPPATTAPAPTTAASDNTAQTRAAAAAARAQASAAKWVVTKVVDGDTIWAARAGVTRKVRLIGVDTPEIGQCGYSEASRNLRGIIGGQPVTLTGGARDDVDRYGRLLRYVDVNGVDAGLRQVKQGYAVARYDSRDGYGRHARETAYVQADRSSPEAPCASPSSRGDGAGMSGATGSTHTSSWPLPGDEHPCPQSRPVKGNEDSMIAHEPGDRYYDVTNPEHCFATMSAAEAAGFRPAKV
ncbi:thermonuclease family protein [Terrabacter terrigena]|uniref:Thermonuclease family protein n=1 Tax=Terrabacter terrigena TaxID=574718 RepID=A0ABW3MX62_9MICO